MDPTTGLGLRADEMVYDPDDGILMVTNNEDTPPYYLAANSDAVGPVLGVIDAENQTLTQARADILEAPAIVKLTGIAPAHP